MALPCAVIPKRPSPALLLSSRGAVQSTRTLTNTLRLSSKAVSRRRQTSLVQAAVAVEAPPQVNRPRLLLHIL